MTIADVQASDGGYYATVNGRYFDLNGEVDYPDCRCDNCGAAEQVETVDTPHGLDEVGYHVKLYADADTCLCDRCLGVRR